MTVLWRGRQDLVGCVQTEKVTDSQDDGFVEGWKTFDWVCEKHETIEKVADSEDEWGRVALPDEIGCW
jgi:hypothetical protein